jgi:hypothetical protein
VTNLNNRNCHDDDRPVGWNCHEDYRPAALGLIGFGLRGYEPATWVRKKPVHR